MSVLLCVRGGLEIEIIEHFATLDPPIEIGRRCADAVSRSLLIASMIVFAAVSQPIV